MLSISTAGRSKRETERLLTTEKHRERNLTLNLILDVSSGHVSTSLHTFHTAEEMGCLNPDPNGRGRRKFITSVEM